MSAPNSPAMQQKRCMTCGINKDASAFKVSRHGTIEATCRACVEKKRSEAIAARVQAQRTPAEVAPAEVAPAEVGEPQQVAPAEVAPAEVAPAEVGEPQQVAVAVMAALHPQHAPKAEAITLNDFVGATADEHIAAFVANTGRFIILRVNEAFYVLTPDAGPGEAMTLRSAAYIIRLLSGGCDPQTVQGVLYF